MKIVQVLTYTDVDGAYGGPATVARRQCEALAARGHEVHLVTGWDGVADLAIHGVQVHPLRSKPVSSGKFSTVFNWRVIRAVRALTMDADVVHLHFARDLMQFAALLGVRDSSALVLQPHGMVRLDKRITAKLVDRIFVRNAYKHAKLVCLTKVEENDALALGASSRRVFSLRNGVPPEPKAACWSGVDGPRILFLARLSGRKRPVAFIKMARLVLAEIPTATFILAGPDEGELLRVQRELDRLKSPNITYVGPVRKELTSGLFASCQVYVLPSVDEPFPMTVLEAMSCGLPVVITDSTGISAELEEHNAGQVTDGTPEALAAATLSLVEDTDVWRTASKAAREYCVNRFSIDAIADDLIAIYQSNAPSREYRKAGVLNRLHGKLRRLGISARFFGLDLKGSRKISRGRNR